MAFISRLKNNHVVRPTDVMTRREFVEELTTMWDLTITKMKQRNAPTSVIKQVENALDILRLSYNVDDLLNIERLATLEDKRANGTVSRK